MEKKEELRTMWWKEYSGMMIDVSGWLVVPIILGLFLGKWLDSKYQTKPWFTVVCVGIAFVITNVGIIRQGIKIMKNMEKKEKKEIADKKEK